MQPRSIDLGTRAVVELWSFDRSSLQAVATLRVANAVLP